MAEPLYPPLGNIPGGLRRFLLEELPGLAEGIDRSNLVPGEVLDALRGYGAFNTGSLGLGGLLEAVRLASMSSPGTAHVILVSASGSIAGGVEPGRIVALSITEPGGGSDVKANLRTRAIEEDGRALITGVKVFTSNAVYADYFLVLAASESGDRLYLVERGSEVSVEPMDLSGFRGAGVGRVAYDNAAGVPVGEPGTGLKTSLQAINVGRLGYASIALGIGETSLQAAIEAGAGKIVFGERLVDKQGPRWMLAESYVGLTTLHSLLSAAIAGASGWKVDPEAAAVAKVYGASVARQAVWSSMQLLGGRGLARWSLTERLWRDVRVLDIGEGAREVLLDFIASRLVKRVLGRSRSRGEGA